MLTKEKVMASIESLPDEFTLDQIIDQLILIQKVEEGRRQSAEGKVIPHEEVKKQFGR